MALPQTIVIHPPLAGEWKCMRPPGHHPYAFDFVQLESIRRSTHSSSQLRFLLGGIAANCYQCWNQPVLAPVDGTVLCVGEGWLDHETTSLWQAIRLWYNATYRFRPREENGRWDIRPNAGNHVMIQADAGYIVFLAHLRNGSITIAEGPKVCCGENVGMVGNSGNTTMPHLHINLFDQMNDPLQAEVLPFVFTAFESLASDGCWKEERICPPQVGRLLRFPSR